VLYRFPVEEAINRQNAAPLMIGYLQAFPSLRAEELDDEEDETEEAVEPVAVTPSAFRRSAAASPNC
jgi:hypothetical protein